MLATLRKSIAHGWRTLVSRKIYIFMMLIVPAGCTWFFLDLMKDGLPIPVPVTLVDLDRSAMSRSITRSMMSNQFVEIADETSSYHQALDKLQRGETYGFFYIPRGFQQKVLSGGQPTLSFFTNMSVFVPGTMSFKGFKTTAVVAKGAIVRAQLTAVGIDGEQASETIQPLVIESHALKNPWLNYSIYLNPSFLSGVIALMTMLATSFSIGAEIKNGTSVKWLADAGGSMLVALTGKLLPQTIVFTAVGVAIEAVMFGFCGYPLNNHPLHIILAMLLLVMACQALALIFCEILPNMRLAMTLCSLTGILSFSIVGFSFPVQQMYGAVGIFSYLIPLRYFFLIYIDQALNGIPLFYSRFYYIALLVFPMVSLAGLPRLKKRCLNPIYVP